MLELIKLDIVTIEGRQYMVSTFEEREGFSTKIHSNGALPRLYYREHDTLAQALTQHNQLVRDVNSGKYKFVRRELKWVN